jgi:hypothetical protein
VSHFVTDGSETVGIGRDGSGTNAAEKPDRITLFGNGRDRLESPSLGSTPGHPKFSPYFTGFFAAFDPFFLTAEKVRLAAERVEIDVLISGAQNVALSLLIAPQVDGDRPHAAGLGAALVDRA